MRWLIVVGLMGCGTGFAIPETQRADGGTPAPPIPPTTAPASCNATSTVVLAEGAGYPGVDQVTLDTEDVYFHAGGVWRVPKAGGTPAVVVPSTDDGWPTLYAFALDGASVSWLSSEFAPMQPPTTFVQRVPKQGGSPAPLATLMGEQLTGILPADQEALYVFSAGTDPDQGFYSVTSLGSATQLASTPYAVTDAAQSAAGVSFCLTLPPNGLGGVYRLDGSSWTTLYTSPEPSVFLAGPLRFDRSHVYFQVHDWREGSIALVSMPQAGGAITTVTTTADELGFADYAVDPAGYVYATERGINDVVRVDTDGGNRTVIASGGTAGSNPVEQGIGIAIDAACVYWGSSDGGGSNHVYAAPR